MYFIIMYVFVDVALSVYLRFQSAGVSKDGYVKENAVLIRKGDIGHHNLRN